MKVKTFEIEGVLLIEPDVFHDDRGYFFESYQLSRFTELGINLEFVQDNQSLSHKGVLRGLHFQNPPYDQGKLIRVVAGSVVDMVVDIRKNSPTYGKYLSIPLTADKIEVLWIPPGFAHGFLSLEDNTVFLYKCTNPYHKQSEQGIIWNDPDIGIDWGYNNPLVSGKDLELGAFKDLNSLF